MVIVSVYYMHKPGGLCGRLYRLLTALGNAGHEVHYLTLDPPPTQFPASVHIHLIRFPLQSRRGFMFWILFTVRVALALAHLVRRVRADRVVVFGPYYAAVSVPARIASGVPVVLFVRSLVHQINRLTEKPRLLCVLSDLLERVGLKSASKIVVMSRAMEKGLKSFLGTLAADVEVLPNAVSDRQDPLQHNPPGECLVLCCSGVLDSRKNTALLLSMMAQLRGRAAGRPVVLYIAGAGPEKTKLERQAIAEGLDEVLFLGWVSEMLPLLKRTHLFLHPSWHEGVSNSVLEALNQGVPLLLSDIPEHRELFNDDCCLLSPAAPELWAERIDAIAQSPQLYRELQEVTARFQDALSFDWETRAVEIATANVTKH